MHTRLIADALRVDSLLEVFGFEGQSSGLLNRIVEQAIDVLLVSSNLDDHSNRGFEILMELRALHLKTQAVLLPESSKDEAILQGFRAGARGVFDKSEPIEQLSKCVRCVQEGQIWANRQAVRVVVEAVASSPTLRVTSAGGMKLLSGRELQVVYCIAEGLTNREIAQRLHLSQHTIKNYLFRIFDKLGVSSRIELLFTTLSEIGTLNANAATPNGLQSVNGRRADKFPEIKKRSASPRSTDPEEDFLMRPPSTHNPESLVSAYMWSLVTTERASQAQEFMTRKMTAQQIEEARQRAKTWLAKLRETSRDCEKSAMEPEASRG